MSKTIKIVIVVLSLLGLIGFAVYQYGQRTLMQASYVDVPDLSSQIIDGEVSTPDGHKRIYQYYQPVNVKDTTSIIYVLHGSGSSGPDMREQLAYEWDVLADQHGFIVVYPTGYDNHWNDCRGKADYQANIQNIDDLTFLKMLEDDLSSMASVVIDARFATGFSNGGHYCFKLALEAPDWIDGIAAISANLPVEENRDCDLSNQFVPTMIINGTDDWINPYEGGLVSIRGNDSRGIVHSSLETIDYFSGLSDCESKSSTTLLADKNKDDDSIIQVFDNECAITGETLTKLYQVMNGGHTLPHPINQLPPILGDTNRDVILAEEIWNFFEGL